ncbi:multidrug resistance protein EbrB [Psychrobacillus sp. OK032]|nr:multidrug resistance protein EbrB [Psychrobacillus sp. OK032]
MKDYSLLSISIVSEIFGTAMLKLSEGFTNLVLQLGLLPVMACHFIVWPFV